MMRTGVDFAARRVFTIEAVSRLVQRRLRNVFFVFIELNDSFKICEDKHN